LAYGTARGRWVIAAAVLGSGIASLDATVVGIALPSIARSFHVGVGSLQWVVTGYSLTLASLILVGGSLGDRLGRRRIFMLGVAWFAVASAICGLAPNSTSLILARAVQGVGGALLTPASLAIMQASFRPDDRSRAIGAWSGLGGLATAAGPLVGGWLIAVGSWRWVFFINIPVAAFVLVISARHVPESSDPTARGRIDLAGVALGVAFLTGLSYGLIEGSIQGWTSAAVLTALIAAGLSGAAFLVVEHRIANPMLPLRMFAVRQFSATNAVTFVVYGALGGALFLLPVELQVVEGYSPLASGLALLPVTVMMLLFSARSGRLASRIGPRLQMSLGPVVVGAAMFLLTLATHGSSYITYVFPGVLVLGIGLAITVAPLTATAMASAPSEHSGIASAVNNVVARSASLIAVAVLPAAAGIATSGTLEASSLAPGFRTALMIAGAVSIAGGLLAALLIRNPPPAPGPRLAPLRDWHCAVDGAPLQAS
jgi:EmrB/QacA subfamily drug resistance transporter